jgi:hypothetical protein
MMQAFRIAALARVRAVFGQPHVDRLCEGWRLLARTPEVIRDLCVLGHLFEPDTDPATGRLYDDIELRARAARKALVLQLLARADITHDELNMIRKDTYNDLAGLDEGNDA